jgi:hypothetical protein
MHRGDVLADRFVIDDLAGSGGTANDWFLGANASARSPLLDLDAAADELGLGTSLRSFILAWIFAESGAFDDARQWAERLVMSGQ